MLTTFDQVVILVFFVLTFGVGLIMPRPASGEADFLLGGRVLTLPAFVATTVSTWYGGILGVGEYSYRYGISNWLVFGLPYYLGAILFALLLSKRARRGDSMTLPHRLAERYGQRVGTLSAVLIFLTTTPAAYVLIIGTLLALSFGIDETVSVFIGASFVVAYLWRGGFTAVIKTDVFQIVLMFGGFILLTGYLFWDYGLAPLQSLDPVYFSPTGGLPVSSVLVWYVIALSTLANPNFFQRAFAAKTPKVAKRGLLVSVGFWVCFDIMTTLCGLYARALLPNLENPMHAFPALGAEFLPMGLVGLFFVGMFATVLSSLDSNMFTAATTIGRDLWPQSKNAAGIEISSRLSIEVRTRIGLVLTAILASGIALASGSVISIWKIFGSVSAAALLVPIMSTYYKPLAMRPQAVLISMASSASLTLLFFLAARLSDASIFKIEPLFVGLGLSLVTFAIDKICSSRQVKSVD